MGFFTSFFNASQFGKITQLRRCHTTQLLQTLHHQDEHMPTVSIVLRYLAFSSAKVFGNVQEKQIIMYLDL